MMRIDHAYPWIAPAVVFVALSLFPASSPAQTNDSTQPGAKDGSAGPDDDEKVHDDKAEDHSHAKLDHGSESAPAPAEDGTATGTEEPQSTQLPESVVTATQDEAEEEEAYQVSETESATRTPTPLDETPISVTTIDEQLIEDQGSLRLKDALRNAPSVSAEKNEGFAIAFENSFIRGFSERLFRDGSRTFATDTIDLANVQRIEVIKGPNAVLYGASEPGGFVNIVTKRPLKTPRYQVTGELGPYGHYRGEVDVSRPITPDEDAAFRIVGSATRSGSFRDFVDRDSEFIAPSFRLDLGDRTHLEIAADYQHERRVIDDGVAFSANGQAVSDIDTFLGEPDIDGTEVRDWGLRIDADHELTDALTLEGNLFIRGFKNELDAVRRFMPTNPNNTVSRFYDGGVFESLTWGGVVSGLYEVDTGPISHQLKAGVDYRNRAYDGDLIRDMTAIADISITNPQYGHAPLNPIRIGAISQSQDWVGVFAQDQVTSLQDRLHLLGALRYDSLWQDSDSADPIHQDALTGRAGALYEVQPWFHPYAQISTSFTPTSVSALNVNGEPIDPEEGLGYELGAKMPLWNDRFTATASVYRVIKDNVARSDPNNPTFSINGGKLRSQGVELGVQGELWSGWSIAGSYAYTDTEVLDSATLPEGSRFRSIPLHQGSLWLRYAFPNGPLEGLRLGGGVFFASDRVGDDAQTFELDGYRTVDLMASYRHPIGESSVFARVNVKNVFDQEYYESSFTNARVGPGRPLTVMLTVGVTY